MQSPEMIKAVFLDFYNTLVRFWPPVEEIQAGVCKELGLKADRRGIRRGYSEADRFFNQENACQPLVSRAPEDRERFFVHYEQLILKGAGLDLSPQLAAEIWKRVSNVPKDLALFDDVMPALQSLRREGITLAVLSNLRQDMAQTLQRLGLSTYVDFYVTSQDAGAEKPHPPIFLAAMERAGIGPSEGIHVGDQYQSDVVGARAVGLLPVLLDREGMYTEVDDCPRIKSLLKLPDLLRQEPW